MIKKKKKRFMKSNLIVPPYLVPYKDAMYQDHFDINYIRFEAWRGKSRQVVDKPKSVTPVYSTSATEYVDMGTKAIDTTTDVDRIKVDDSWIGEW